MNYAELYVIMFTPALAVSSVDTQEVVVALCWL